MHTAYCFANIVSVLLLPSYLISFYLVGIISRARFHLGDIRMLCSSTLVGFKLNRVSTYTRCLDNETFRRMPEIVKYLDNAKSVKRERKRCFPMIFNRNAQRNQSIQLRFFIEDISDTERWRWYFRDADFVDYSSGIRRNFRNTIGRCQRLKPTWFKIFMLAFASLEMAAFDRTSSATLISRSDSVILHLHQSCIKYNIVGG